VSAFTWASGRRSSSLKSIFFEIHEAATGARHEGREEEWIIASLDGGALSGEDYVRREGETRWRKIASIRRLASHAPAPEPILRRTPEPAEVMDLTPLVDVTFLLLLFFMLTASFTIQKTIEAPQPESDERRTAQALVRLEDLKRENVIVRIDADNAISVDEEETPVASVAAALRQRLRSTGKTQLVIKADDEALHEAVVAVIDAANEVGMQRIRIATAAQIKEEQDGADRPATP